MQHSANLNHSLGFRWKAHAALSKQSKAELLLPELSNRIPELYISSNLKRKEESFSKITSFSYKEVLNHGA